MYLRFGAQVKGWHDGEATKPKVYITVIDTTLFCVYL